MRPLQTSTQPQESSPPEHRYRFDWLRASITSGFIATFAMTVTAAIAFGIANAFGEASGNALERNLHALMANQLTESVGDALSFGWAKFQANIGSIVLSALVLLVGVGLVAVLGFFAGLVLQAVLAAVLLVVFQVIAADLIRAALTVIDGGSWEFSEVLRTDKIGKVVVTALIVGAITVVGTLLCYFPGLIAGFMLSYSLYFVVDRDLEPMAAVKASVELTKNNLGNTLVWYIVGAIVAFAGFLACGVGALVSLPVVLLGTAYSYRMLTGGTVVR